jgi:hypothetical protein
MLAGAVLSFWGGRNPIDASSVIDGAGGGFAAQLHVKQASSRRRKLSTRAVETRKFCRRDIRFSKLCVLAEDVSIRNFLIVPGGKEKISAFTGKTERNIRAPTRRTNALRSSANCLPG